MVGGNLHVADNPEGATSGTHSGTLSAGGDSQGDTLVANATIPISGRSYALDFDAGISVNGSGSPLQVQVEVIGNGTVLNQTITPPDAGTFNPGSVIFQHYHFTFTANSNTSTIRFTSVGLGNASADQLIDTVAYHSLTSWGHQPQLQLQHQLDTNARINRDQRRL